MRIIFGGYIVDSNSSRTRISAVIEPDDATIAKTVSVVGERAGVLGMRRDPPPEFGPTELTLYAEGGRFLLALTEVAEDGEANVRTLKNCNTEDDLICILGEKYPAKAITDDLTLVFSAFREFAQTGTVSNKLMN